MQQVGWSDKVAKVAKATHDEPAKLKEVKVDKEVVRQFGECGEGKIIKVGRKGFRSIP